MNFPNRSRSFNPERMSITFWGSDRTLEVTFEVDQSVFMLIDSEATTEDDYLHVFDANRQLIEAAAVRAYEANTDTFYILNKDDL